MRKRQPHPDGVQTIDLGPLSLRADVRPETIDVEERTVDLVFSTGAPVMRYDWNAGERYTETLSLKPSAVRLDRLNSGAPFLNSHDGYDLDGVLGVVVSGSARVTNGKGYATVRLSRRDDVEPVWQDIRDGIVRNVSVGYKVHKYEQTEASEGKPAMRHAIDWEPFEISAVPMPADSGAQMRAEKKAQLTPCVIVTRAAEEVPMEEILCQRCQHSNPKAQKFCGKCSSGLETAAATPPPQTILDPVAPLPIPEAQRAAPAEPTDRDLGAASEQQRIQGILLACEAARLPMSIAHGYIKSNRSLQEIQTEILEGLRTRGVEQRGPAATPSGVRVVGEDPLENVWRGMTDAILHKVAPEYFPLTDIGRPYRSRSLLAAGELCLHHRGVKTHDLSKMELAGLVLGLQVRAGLHGTSDFPNILADVANKTLRRAYQEAPQTWMPIARRINMPDFKAVKRNQLGEAPALLKVLEHGEFTRGTVAEGKEQFQLATYGRIFGITRQALVNDDLDAFGRLTMSFGRSARNLESDIVWGQVLNTSALMGDGAVLFVAGHGNLATISAKMAVESVGSGFSAMQIQTGLDGATYLNITPRYLAVPPALVTPALQMTATITPAQTSNDNPYSGLLTPISEPRLQGGVTIDGTAIAGSSTAWYLFASPDQIDIIEYGYLDGEDGPVVESRIGFDVDGLEIKCRHDFAAKIIDWRGTYKNAGA